MTVKIIQGDCRDVLRELHDDSVDAIVTDPPYHLTNASGGPANNNETPFSRARAGASSTGFMGLKWDGGDVAFQAETWRAVLRVLKPGGHILAFSGSRTYHRLVCAIEDAGFEIRDQIMWLYGSGFPKSRNLNGVLEGWGTALKPAHEPIVLARKPLIGTVAANVVTHGTGALHIKACRVETDERIVTFDREAGDRRRDQYRTGTGVNRREVVSLGRWPANVIHDGSEEVLSAFPDAPGQKSDLVGQNRSMGIFRGMTSPRYAAARVDGGSAARFFYCAKASRADRNAGLQCSLEPVVSAGATMREREAADWPSRNGNYHPTVKPTELMRYLCRLVTPPGGIVLDPFMGSGSTGRGAVLEGFQFIGIEVSEAYVEIAHARISDAQNEARAEADERRNTPADLFAEVAAQA